MVIEGYKNIPSGFPGALENWVPEVPGTGPIITFILKSDRRLQEFWRRSYPDFYPLATKSGPRAAISPDDRKWIYVRLY